VTVCGQTSVPHRSQSIRGAERRRIDAEGAQLATIVIATKLTDRTIPSVYNRDTRITLLKEVPKQAHIHNVSTGHYYTDSFAY